jgi:uncharacterized membrane protein YGL010W
MRTISAATFDLVRGTIIAICLGALLGIVSARYVLVGSALSLVPWAVCGICIGYFNDRRGAMINGAVYGFVLSFAFMCAGYTGPQPIMLRVPFFLVLGLIGAVCGFALGNLGFLFRSMLAARKG